MHHTVVLMESFDNKTRPNPKKCIPTTPRKSPSTLATRPKCDLANISSTIRFYEERYLSEFSALQLIRT